MMAPNSERTLIDKLLEDQRELTAAERFSRRHSFHELPAQAKYYRDLIPMTLPKKGEQYAFEVDLDKCSGCKACVTACHNLNGLAENETWRSVGTLHGGTTAAPFQMTVTTACHHCVDPACLNGCPVLAYEKDSVTGIVHHLDDQCIGCQYCVLKCPYEVPSYLPKQGIVRKCDMCSNRLLTNEAPACVQACPNEAIRITIVDQREATVTTCAGDQLVPGAPESVVTIPATKYRTKRDFPANTRPADFGALNPAQAHPPLVVMLVLTQLSVGMFALAWLNPGFIANASNEFARIFVAVAFGAGAIGIGSSVLHLGRPLQAWRAFLGWRKSWLSREVLLFGLLMGLAAVLTLSMFGKIEAPQSILKAAVSLSGLAAIYSSVMVYADTGRAFWSAPRASLRFFGSAALLGISASIALAVNFAKTTPGGAIFTLMFLTAAKIAWEIYAILRPSNEPSLRRSALLQAGPLKRVTVARFLCSLTGGFILPCVLLMGTAFAPAVAMAAFAFRLAGELLERHLFFVAVVPPKMPGVAK
jgi:formate dehydrogenase iron-sulfur subunit